MRRSRGFTLVELLVAMAVVAIIGVMAFAGLNQVIAQRDIASERAERWREIQLAVRILVQDLAQIHPRPTRDELGATYMPSVFASPDATFALEFSRGGWSNPASLPRGNVMRIAYDWEDELLVRYQWPVMDRTLATVPVRTELLTGVTNIFVEFLDASGTWQAEWPIGGDFASIQAAGNVAATGRMFARPRAVRFLIELEDYGEIWRTVETSG